MTKRTSRTCRQQVNDSIEERKTERIVLRITPLERAEIQAAAAEAGLTLGQYIRHRPFVEAVDSPDTVHVKNPNPKPGDPVYIRADVAKEFE